jgi:hypothetical protein
METEIYENALLSAAAYADYSNGIGDPSVKIELLKKRGFTEVQYNKFLENYSVMYYEDDPVSGFSAALFKNEVTGKLTVSYRGTNPGVLDFYQDFWLALGLGSIGGTQNNSAVEFLQNAGLIDAFGQINETYGNAVTFTGHSLGGYLALVAAYAQPDLLENVYTYNGAGITGLDQFFLATVLPWLNSQSSNPLGSHNTTHIYADKGLELASGLWFNRPGSYQTMFIENEHFLSVENHSIERMVESLSMYRVLNLLDSTADTNSIYELLDAAASVPLISLETVVNQLGDMLGGNLALAANKNDIELFYQEVNALVNTAQSQTNIIFLANSNAQSIAAIASQNTEEGRAYRYALVNATSFTLLTNIAGAAIASSDYDLANYTEQYLQDRAQYLSNLLHYNTIDADVDYETIVPNIQDLAFYSDPQTTSLVTFTSDSGEPIVIDETLKTSLGDDDAYRHFIFDNDEDNDQLNGKDQNDHIYGAGGNDTLDGGKGNDYLEGGIGDDTYHFDYGDGRDRIVDNGAADEKNKLFITHTDGGTASQVSRLALLAGSSVYQEVDAAGDVINPATTYALISNAAGQDSLLITVDGGKGGSITHQFDNRFAHWSSSFLYMSKDANQRKHIPPSSPEGALTFDKNKRSALCHIPVAKRLKSTSCCLNPLFVSTLDLMKGKLAA